MTHLPETTELTIHPLAESGLLVELGATIDLDLTNRIMALTAALDAAALPGVHDLVPSYTTILVAFDPTLTDIETVAREVRRLVATVDSEAPPPGRSVTIPVVYGGAHGPDLDAVAAHTGLRPDDVIARHHQADYRVACMGFAPGFAFLVGLPSELEIPRRATPRTRVPIGSVAIGGAQTGIYPLETPGGWHLIGRTPRRLFDPARHDPFLLQPGDALTFQPIAPAAYDAYRDDPPAADQPVPESRAE